MGNIIEVKKINKYFPGVHALVDIDFTLQDGEILGLVGENGAGKSTLNKVLSGVEPFDSGEYCYCGESVNFKSAKEAIDNGISVIHQELNLCETMTVAENICIGNYPIHAKILLDRKTINSKAKDALKEVGITDVPPNRKVEFLSSAQKQLVEIARATSRDSKVIIMDEPTSALAPNEIKQLHGIMRDLKAKGISIIYISHKLDEIFDICDRVSIMRDGHMIDTLPITEVSRDDMIAKMVGREVDEVFHRTAKGDGEKILEVEHLCNEKVDDVSFYVRKGEIVCFSGLMGAGRTETVRALFGFDKRTSGTVKLDGELIPANSTEKSTRKGIGFVSEDRKLEGIFPLFSVSDNMSIADIANLSKGKFFVSPKRVAEAVTEGIKNFGVKTTGPKQVMATLSGGNQQKVILARWLMKKDLKLLIIDEPTRGIDVGAKSEIYALMDQLANNGLAIIMVSSEMQEIINVCDRVYVMKEGRITGELDRSEVTQTKLMEYAIL